MRIATAVAKGTSTLKEVLANGLDTGFTSVLGLAIVLLVAIGTAIGAGLGAVGVAVPSIAGVAKRAPALGKEFAHLRHDSASLPGLEEQWNHCLGSVSCATICYSLLASRVRPGQTTFQA